MSKTVRPTSREKNISAFSPSATFVCRSPVPRSAESMPSAPFTSFASSPKRWNVSDSCAFDVCILYATLKSVAKLAWSATVARFFSLTAFSPLQRRCCASRRSESLRFVERSERASVSSFGIFPSLFARPMAARFTVMRISLSAPDIAAVFFAAAKSLGLTAASDSAVLPTPPDAYLSSSTRTYWRVRGRKRASIMSLISCLSVVSFVSTGMPSFARTSLMLASSMPPPRKAWMNASFTSKMRSGESTTLFSPVLWTWWFTFLSAFRTLPLSSVLKSTRPAL